MPAVKVQASDGAFGVLSRARLGLLGAAFAVSGAAALIYEAVWQREFTHLFGSSASATAVVLAAYFTGLGAGSFLMGRLAARWENPLLAYAILELVVGGSALLVPEVLSLYSRFYSNLEQQILVKGVLAFAAIALPTMAMGGTLPVLAQLFEERRSQLGRMAGLLYMLNTVGGAAGIAVFLWLWASGVGLRRMTFVCAGCNLLAALIAFALFRKVRAPTMAGSRKDERVPRSLVALAFVSGSVTFILQVSWNRAFAQVHENSIFSFAMIVGLFLVGMAIGAEFARVLLKRRRLFKTVIAASWMTAGVFIFASPFLFLTLTNGLQHAAHFTGKLLIIGALVVGVPVILLAVALPLIFQEIASRCWVATGRLTGTAIAANITGAVLGAIAAGFVFPEFAGVWGTKFFIALLIMGTSGMILAKSKSQRVGIGVAASVFFIFAMRFELPRARIEGSRGERLLAVREGAHGIVAVTERAGSRRLKLNNHYVLGGTAATGDERLQAHIPLMLHANPESAVFLGYGTGITAGGSLFHSGLRITALELVPEIAELAAEWFAAENLNFETRTNAQVVIEDGRTFVRGTQSSYDVIVGDLVVPWRQGEGALYTLEHFVTARERLSSNGVYCAWLPLFQLGEEDFQIVLRTFIRAFDMADVWRGDFSPTEPAIALIGCKSTGGLAKPDEIAERLQKITADPSNPQLKHETAFWMNFVGRVDATSLGTKSQRVNTLDQPWLELNFRSERRFVGRSLQMWQKQVRADSIRRETMRLPPQAERGWQAGELLLEYTLLLSERRQREAQAVQQVIRTLVGTEVGQTLFGN